MAVSTASLVHSIDSDVTHNQPSHAQGLFPMLRDKVNWASLSGADSELALALALALEEVDKGPGSRVACSPPLSAHPPCSGGGL